MHREELTAYIAETYAAQPDRPWARYPDHMVFRHGGNKKWFALIMTVPKARLEPGGEGVVDILNVKCDPILIGSLRTQPGFYPAYHMNKASWLTIALDGRVEDGTIKTLLDMSYDLTVPRGKHRKTPDPD